MEKMDLSIKKFVFRIRRRLREQSIINDLLLLVIIGLLVALIISIISLAVPFYYALFVSAGIIVLSFVAGIMIGVKKTPTPMEAALKADAKGYQEKISTAFFLSGKSDVFSCLLKKEVLDIEKRFVVRKEFPLYISWKHVVGLVILAVLFTVSSLTDTPAKEKALTQHDVKEEVKDEIAQLEKVEKTIAEQKEISQSELAEVKKQMEAAKGELSEAETKEELKKASERIAKKMEQKSEKTENRTLSETLNRAAQEAKDRISERDRELAEAAKKALKQAEDGTNKDKQEAFQKLKDLAESLGDEELEQAAEDYKASQYSDSDFAKAQNALNNAVSKQANSLEDYASQNANSNNNSNNNHNAAQSAQTSGQATVSSGNHQNGTQSVANAGQSNNNGSQGKNGAGQSGNGNNSGTGSSGGSGAGGGWNYGGKNGHEGAAKMEENITVPDGELGEDENLTGKANGNESSTKAKSNQANTWSGNKVNYGQVSGKYKNKAYKKINGANYPGKLKDKIRNYFEGLN